MQSTENIDLDELEKFSSRAEQWWDTQGEFKTLHQINPVRLQFINSHMSLQDKHILDVGCGGGILAEAMAKQKAHVTAIDASKENINIASQHATDNDLEINYQTLTAETFSENNIAKFDLVTCMELLEHVPDPASVILACSKMVKPGGHVMFSTINRNVKAYLLAVLTGEYLLKLLPKGTHQYEKFIRPSELLNWCNESELKMNDLAGMHYNPLIDRCSLTKNVDVNYLLDTIKLN
ncbi:MAG TPA: bifunctional 2-polyprenyl-6-hydroxyphenol methylase/3-demethylubiquinol 3-O-methyltransferase UbiG [Thiotrichaceae bacterium]|jgi:2-polyprenyl-6-hydroxyphenyl methylase/3-demethylubiquinone-9 3-methyltransferase|nr:bifunctional 2-polyprenyl-6-hydroxyphenol methylase/3-demethylubiquinol 3-O-methyltransferase UbiG [Thiotrichaceae bacterium]HIM09005.1 bifunctional 2-polyprenyl-6-hydroxyphenol methylase/3-demethylubiquinol 3-O-methyltransferase UbiG [Gammaproteobacteria bacterium]